MHDFQTKSIDEIIITCVFQFIGIATHSFRMKILKRRKRKLKNKSLSKISWRSTRNNNQNSQSSFFHSSYSDIEQVNPGFSSQQCSVCCEDFSTQYPYSFTIFLPGKKEVVREFVVSRHRLTTSGLKCRLRMGLNTFNNGCQLGEERVLRIEAVSKVDLISCIDLLDSVFPQWKVWKRGKTDEFLL